jgi:hypothetical protein
VSVDQWVGEWELCGRERLTERTAVDKHTCRAITYASGQTAAMIFVTSKSHRPHPGGKRQSCEISRTTDRHKLEQGKLAAEKVAFYKQKIRGSSSWTVLFQYMNNRFVFLFLFLFFGTYKQYRAAKATENRTTR